MAKQRKRKTDLVVRKASRKASRAPREPRGLSGVLPPASALEDLNSGGNKLSGAGMTEWIAAGAMGLIVGGALVYALKD